MSDTINGTPIDELATWVAAYKEATSNVKDWQDTADRAKQHITDALTQAGADVGTIAGRPVVTWTPVASTRFDAKKFREQYPELAEQFTVPSESRRFTLTRRA